MVRGRRRAETRPGHHVRLGGAPLQSEREMRVQSGVQYAGSDQRGSACFGSPIFTCSSSCGIGVSSTHGTTGAAEVHASVETTITPESRHVQPRAAETAPQAISPSSMRRVIPQSRLGSRPTWAQAPSTSSWSRRGSAASCAHGCRADLDVEAEQVVVARWRTRGGERDERQEPERAGQVFVGSAVAADERAGAAGPRPLRECEATPSCCTVGRCADRHGASGGVCGRDSHPDPDASARPFARRERAVVLAFRQMPSPRRVLVVDDSEPVRSLLAQALRHHGYAVYEADTGTAALRVAFDVRPAAAIVDQWMPGMTGAELIRLLRAAPIPELRAMPIIGLSGRAGSERDLLGAGAGSFLAKPFGEAELIVALRAALGVTDDDDLPDPGERRA